MSPYLFVFFVLLLVVQVSLIMIGLGAIPSESLNSVGDERHRVLSRCLHRRLYLALER